MSLPAADVETASEGYARRFAGPVGAWFLEIQARLTLELLAPWAKIGVFFIPMPAIVFAVLYIAYVVQKPFRIAAQPKA